MRDRKLGTSFVVVIAVALGLLLTSCAGGGVTRSSAAGPKAAKTHPPKRANPPKKANPKPTQAPVPAESNPPGDIPDSTAFVPYVSSAGHFEISVPEGWARRTRSSEVIFTSKLNQVDARWGSGKSSMHTEIASLERTVPAFQLEKTSKVTLPGGPATLIQYQANSKPNAVTGKQYRLDVLQFDFIQGSRAVALTLSSPVGADNVDPWRMVSESFQWK